jgi:hypothetical protein
MDTTHYPLSTVHYNKEITMIGNTKKRSGLLLTICAVVVTSALVLAGCDNGGGGGEQSQQSSTDTTVTAFDLTALITKPAHGASPVTTISTSGTAQYTGSVEWMENAYDTPHTGVFAAGTIYKAVVTLTASSGYTFTGVAENSFTYTGAVVTNAADSGVVTLIFKATPPPPPPPPMSVSDLGQLLDTKLDEITGDTETNPQTVVLPNTVEIDTDDTAPNGIWATVNSKVQRKQKYVILDLSACTAVNNTIDGYGDGYWGNIAISANKMNIIQNNQYIKGIILPGSVTTIGNMAFYRCASLTSVTIPASVTTIAGYDFSRCTRLTSVTIPDSVTTIAGYAFSGCDRLTSVTIPASVTNIFNCTFYGCSSLTSVTIPDSITTIEGRAFSNCTSLTSVTIPASVTTIWGYVFSGCDSLTSVTFADGSNISENKFDAYSFDENGDLYLKYFAPNGGAGTYTREANGNTWSKQ